MASAETAMTPAQALATVASVRAYRERLTGRAAGLVWIVWGFALALLASNDMIGLAGDATASGGSGVRTDGPALTALLLLVAVLAGGALASNVIWKAHALERGTTHRSWVTWLAVLGLLVAIGGVGFLMLTVLLHGSSPGDPASSQVLVWPLVGAVAAGLLAILQRRRVAWWPGLLCALVLVALQVGVGLSVDLAREREVFVAVQASMVGILVLFVATGLWYAKRG